ncbi:5,10-methylenetetrahydrofolate reductase [Achromatium sp. WMS1]|nr:5,10-methylenetetrahydrofolate reductase [Achromatium sp. WMS1]
MTNTYKDDLTFSFELFPPKTVDGLAKLKTEVAKLNKVQPRYFSVTYGAGGSTRDRTFTTVDWLCSQGIETAPHLSCIGLQQQEILDLLNHYQKQSIRRIVALRGDLPSGMGSGLAGDLRYANELVKFIRKETGDLFHIEVAAYPEIHPQARNAQLDLQHFQRKVQAGANAAITQYFYNSDAYFAFRDSCTRLNINIPIVPGIMPITNYKQLARFSDACGAEIPRWIRKRLENYQDDIEGIQEFGHEVVTNLCQRLLDGGAPGLHFYTMNQATSVLNIWQALGLHS